MFKQEEPHRVTLKKVYDHYIAKGKGEKYAEAQADIVSQEFLAHPLKYFCPNLIQERMINEFNECVQEAKISTFLATIGNQDGKTFWFIHLLGNLIWGVQNGWFDLEVFRNWRFPKRLWLATTPGNLKETYFNQGSESSFYNIFRNKNWIGSDNKPGYSKRMSFPDTGWDASVYTYNQAPSEFESAQVGIMGLDEPTPFSIWEGLPARLSAGGVFVMPQTPENIDAYIITGVVKKAAAGVPGYRHIKGNTYEVTTDKERGHYDPEVLKDQVARFSKDEVQIRVFGEILYFKERVIEGLNDKLHKVEPADYPLMSNYLYFHVIDPHPSRPNAEIWAALTPDGRYIIFNERPDDKSIPFWDMLGSETYIQHKTRVEFKEAWMRREYNINFTVQRIMDRHYGNQQRVPTEESTIKEYRKPPINWTVLESYTSRDKGSEREFGHKKIQQLLGILPDGKPGLVIWNTCYHTWNSLTNAIRKRPRTEAELMKPAGSGTIVEKYYCFVSNVRYLVCKNVFGVKEEKPVKDYFEHKDDVMDY